MAASTSAQGTLQSLEASLASGSGSGEDKRSDASGSESAHRPENLEDGGKGEEHEPSTIADPLESFNRAMYHFNDTLYFWVLKPVAERYNLILYEPARAGVSNFFSNLKFPIRFVNSLLQADFSSAATEIARFAVNTGLGLAGLVDLASTRDFNLPKRDGDLGQTLGVYGVGQGFYILWPIIGPSSPRDSIGLAGDALLYPVTYLSPWYAAFGVRGYEKVNDTSLSIGDYEALKEAALDPYVALRDAYVQFREQKVKARRGPPEPLKPEGAK
jgi:phospholipid-binding lipoprotein MlaA